MLHFQATKRAGTMFFLTVAYRDIVTKDDMCLAVLIRLIVNRIILKIIEDC